MKVRIMALDGVCVTIPEFSKRNTIFCLINVGMCYLLDRRHFVTMISVKSTSWRDCPALVLVFVYNMSLKSDSLSWME